MQTIFASTRQILLALVLFLVVQMAGVHFRASSKPETQSAIRPMAVADSTSILGLFGMATAATGAGKRKPGVKKAR